MTPVYNVCIQRKQHQTQVILFVIGISADALAGNQRQFYSIASPNGEHYMVSDWQDLLNHVHLFAGDNIGMVGYINNDYQSTNGLNVSGHVYYRRFEPAGYPSSITAGLWPVATPQGYESGDGFNSRFCGTDGEY